PARRTNLRPVKQTRVIPSASEGLVVAAVYDRRLSIRSILQLKKLALKRPVFRLPDQASAHRISANVLPLLTVRFRVAHHAPKSPRPRIFGGHRPPLQLCAQP